MVNINTGLSDSLFELNGKQYRKGMYEVYYVTESDGVLNTIGIRNIYSQEPLVSPKRGSEFTVNGDSFTDTDLASLVNALSDTLGFKTGGGGSSVETDPIFNAWLTNKEYVPMAGMDWTSGEHATGVYVLSSFNILSTPPSDGFYKLSNFGEAEQTVGFRTSTVGVKQPYLSTGTSTIAPNEIGQVITVKNVDNDVLGVISKIRNSVGEGYSFSFRSIYNIVSGITSSIDIDERWNEENGGSIVWTYKESGSNVADFKFDSTGIYSTNSIDPSSNTHYVQKQYVDDSVSSQVEVISTVTHVLTSVKQTLILTLEDTNTSVDLPLISTCIGTVIFISNIGSTATNINCNVSDGNGIWTSGTESASINLSGSSTVRLVNDGLKYRVI